MNEKPKAVVEIFDVPEDLKKAIADLMCVIHKQAHEHDRGSLSQLLMNETTLTLQVIAVLANFTVKSQADALIEIANKGVEK